MGFSGDLNRDTLFRLYVDEKKSTVKIASLLGVSSETVRKMMAKFGIPRRSLSQAASGELNPGYKHGNFVGGYVRKGWNPWNKGLTKETDSRVLLTSCAIRRGIASHPSSFKPLELQSLEACRFHARATALSLRSREGTVYPPFIALLGPLWTCEYYQDDFVFVGDDGFWRFYILDLACPSSKVAVEIDGVYHDSPAQKSADLVRDQFLDSIGWVVVRVVDFSDFSARLPSILRLCNEVP